MENKNTNNLLIAHSCCAVCLCYPSIELKNWHTIFYFYNPNIYPIDEYERRRDEFIKYSSKNNLNIYVEESGQDKNNWYSDIKGLENAAEKGARCDKCFYHRLTQAFHYAKSVNARYVTTVMTVSPHKDSKKIESIANRVAESFDGIEYLFIDFKKQDGFKKTNILANEAGLYRQKYCGCEFSIRK